MAHLNGYYSSQSNLKTTKTTQDSSSFVMERGPRYNDYAALRESKLRMKNNNNNHQHDETGLTPPRKQVKFQANFGATPTRPKGLLTSSSSSKLAQSVPDFSAALRKENRKPTMMIRPPVSEKSMTPPSKSGSNGRMLCGKMMSTSGGGSKSANNSGEKRGGGIMGRKSYANLEELKSFSSLAGSAIVNGGGTGRVGVGRKTILGTKHFF